MRHVISITDLSADEISGIVKSAIKLKAGLKQKTGQPEPPLRDKSMAMIFDKSSLRTRLSFEVGMTQLGGHAVYLAPDDIKLGVRETVHDSAIVISSMADVIIARVSSHEAVQELAKYSSVPVINAMTDQEHPCQILADLQTIYEQFGTFEGIKIAYLGDADNNITNSLVLATGLLGMEISIGAPKGYELSPAIGRKVDGLSQFNDPESAVKGAHVVIADTWVSMGKEADRAKRLNDLSPFQVDQNLMGLADKKAIFMHCLPAYRGKEVTAEVIDGPQSVVFAEAENRLHAEKALLLHVLEV
ncbi:MAG TPA: ornithine carbamoyltransferase [Candidatus Dormibacteraeota bacterium]|nr:ornithine carbamoyltransferase [Candidatus Dormibacteraeota bacterium]